MNEQQLSDQIRVVSNNHTIQLVVEYFAKRKRVRSIYIDNLQTQVTKLARGRSWQPPSKGMLVDALRTLEQQVGSNFGRIIGGRGSRYRFEFNNLFIDACKIASKGTRQATRETTRLTFDIPVPVPQAELDRVLELLSSLPMA